MIRAAILAAVLVLAAPAVSARTVAEAPEEPRIRALAQTLRCPVCQSESILESRSSTAAEMMVILREMVAAGRSDAEIVEFFRSRYGNFVMLAPPSSGAGSLIWWLPGLLLLGGGIVLLRVLRRPGEPGAEPSDAAPHDADQLRETRL